MMFEGKTVPGGCFVEIVSITDRDGSPLDKSNWRKKLIGKITLCWIGGGLRQRGAFFKTLISMEKGKVVELILDYHCRTSTTTAQPVEVEPNVFDFETNKSIYCFRLLSEEEEKAVLEAIDAVITDEYEKRFVFYRENCVNEFTVN